MTKFYFIMSQSNSYESNVKGISSFWQNHTVDPPLPREEPSDLQWSENIDIRNLLNPIERHHPQPPELEIPPANKTETQKKHA